MVSGSVEPKAVVVMTGRVDPASVPAIYAASQVVVDPVLDDATARARSPLKVIEASACGVPVVTGNVGDRSELLGAGRAGLLVTPGSPESLAEGLLSLLENPAQLACMAEAARQLRGRFGWDVLAREFVKIYDG